MKGFKAFIKPLEAPQRNEKMKIQVNFFSSSGREGLSEFEQTY